MLDFAQFEVLSFDCYGTLIDWESGILSAIRPILANHGKDAADHQLLTIYSELESEAEQGSYRPYREVLSPWYADLASISALARRALNSGHCLSLWQAGLLFRTPSAR